MKYIRKDNIILFYFIYLLIGTYAYLILQINEFPQKYVFTEWLINYEGGYVNRGLLGHIKFVNVLKYLLIIILNSIPFLFFVKFKKLHNLRYLSTKNIFFIFFLLSLPVYGLVMDWGRVIHINYNFFIILLLFFFNQNLINLDYTNIKAKKLNSLYKITILIFICFVFSPDIMSINKLEYFPLPSQFIRFLSGAFEKFIELY